MKEQHAKSLTILEPALKKDTINTGQLIFSKYAFIKQLQVDFTQKDKHIFLPKCIPGTEKCPPAAKQPTNNKIKEGVDAGKSPRLGPKIIFLDP